MADHPRSYRMRLPPRPASVGRARRLVRRGLSRAGRADLAEAAELLVSEVVTNALVHAGTPIDVALSMDADGVRVEVADGSPHLPARRSYGPNAGTGRGLMMLENLVDDWGVVPERWGKTVWFQLDGEPSGEELTGLEPGTTGAEAGWRSGTTSRIMLLDVPLLLHAAWQQHAESVLREHLLTRLDSDTEVDPIQEHADASDAMAILAEHIPRPQIADEPDQLMASAVEPYVSAPRVDVLVPESSVSHFDTLNRALESAMSMAASGALLTPPTQPELQSLRRWLCSEVRGQTGGSPPTPWPVGLIEPQAPADLAGWDVRPVRESPQAVIAADDTSRIVAVSPSVVELLGYRGPDQLEGRRLVAVIPERFRQAHLAGFTMHVLTGRGPLLGKPIVVPALRGSGEEMLVELVINAHPTPAGRIGYVASLRAAED